MIKNLKLLRNRRCISQQALAAAVGVSQQSINKYENHNIEPDTKTLMTSVSRHLRRLWACLSSPSINTKTTI